MRLRRARGTSLVPHQSSPADVLSALWGTPADQLVDNIATLRGRPITISTFDESDGGGICGAYLPMDTHDVVFISARHTGFHRDHVLLHELSHMLLDHSQPESVTFADDVAPLFPDLPPDLIRRILGRTHYDDPQEREAETLTSRILASTLGSNRSAWIGDPRLRRAAPVMGGAGK